MTRFNNENPNKVSIHTVPSLGVLNNRKFAATDAREREKLPDKQDVSQQDIEFTRVHKAVLLSPGRVISMTILNIRGAFRQKTTSGIHGKTLMAKASQRSYN